MKQTKVTVVASAEGVVARPNPNNPEFGHIRVSQTTHVMENGFARKMSCTALINGKLADLREMGLKAGEELEGKIIVKESLTPFNKENPDGDLKLAGESKVPCTIGGQPIYRKSFYVTDASVDELIAHDNTDEIKAAQAALEGLGE